MRTRLYAAGVLAGLAALGVLIVLLVGPGRYHPSPPDITAHPLPDAAGEILYVDPDGCIVRARASGESRQRVTCPGPETGLVTWVDATTIGFQRTGKAPSPTWVQHNLQTGAETTTAQYPLYGPPDPVSVRGERAEFDGSGSLYRVTGTERLRIFRFEGPRDQRPTLVTWSPDGEWLLLGYRGELWIVRRDGTEARTLANARMYWQPTASWWIDGYGFLPKYTLSDRAAAGTPPAGAVPVPAGTTR